MQRGVALALQGHPQRGSSPVFYQIIVNTDKFLFVCNFLAFVVQFLRSLPFLLVTVELGHHQIFTMIINQPRHQLRWMHFFNFLNFDALSYSTINLPRAELPHFICDSPLGDFYWYRIDLDHVTFKHVVKMLFHFFRMVIS